MTAITIDRSQFFHTPEQVEALTAGLTMARASYLAMMKQARRLHDNHVAAGTVNADGTTVRHGANRDVKTVCNGLLDAAGQLAFLIDRDYVDLVRYEVRYLGKRFLSECEMNERYSHCLALIPALKAKFDGIETV